MIVLDTNVVSAIMLRQRIPAVDQWLNTIAPDRLWLPTLVVYEIRGGIEVKVAGRKKRDLAAALDTLISAVFADRILPFDQEASIAAARIGGDRERRGRPAGEIDTMLAGICVSRNAAIATRNVRHFADLDVDVIDPWAASA